MSSTSSPATSPIIGSSAAASQASVMRPSDEMRQAR
jgi:hypothetical protein